MRILLLLLCIIGMNYSYCQYNSPRNNNWVFGGLAGINFSNGNNPAAFSSAMSSSEAAASVSDKCGNLLFYTDGTTIWNKDGNIMPNGDTLTGVLYQVGTRETHKVTTSSIQGALIVPWPDQPDLYFIFSIIHQGVSDYMGCLFYSVVDMSLDGGLGDVAFDKKGILIDSFLTEAMVGISGENNNVWVVVHSRLDAVFKAFEITATGVRHNPVTSVSGSFVNANSFNNGDMVCPMLAAPNRKKIVLSAFHDIDGDGNLEIYDFNPLTGVVSNALSLSPWPTPRPVDTLQFWAAAFSPNSSKLYVQGYTTSSNQYMALYQYDVSLPSVTEIINSRVFIDSCHAGLIRLGPDGKIYMLEGYDTNQDQIIGRINCPDASGILCDFESDVMLLSGNYLFGFGSEVAVPFKPVASVSNDTITKMKRLLSCFNKSMPLTGSFGLSYLWNTGAATQEIIVDTPGMYWVYSNNGCTNYIDSFEVFIADIQEVQINNGCQYRHTDSGRVIIIFPSSEQYIPYHLKWFDEHDNLLRSVVSIYSDTFYRASGNYYVKITPQVTGLSDCSHKSCDTVISFTISDPPVYNVSFSTDSIMCQQQLYPFQNTSTGHWDTWYWNFGDGHTSDQQNTQHSFAVPGIYQIVLIGSNNAPCQDTFYRDIVVDTFGQVNFTMDKTELCTGDYIKLFPEYKGSATGLYWNLGDGNSYEGEHQEMQHAYDRAGIYSITLTGKFRTCPDTSYTHSIKIYPMPLVHLSSDTTICLPGAPIKLRNIATNQDSYRYLWSTGATVESIEVKYPGTYTLTVTSDQGCSTTESIEVRKDCYTDIPNSFTPNGDGMNDYFYPRQLLTRAVISFRMQVYSRWGEKVFETLSADGRGWDGKVGGKEQPTGVYIYKIDAEFDNGSKERYEGNVTLIR